MRIKSLKMKDFCGYPSAEFTFGDFSCLIGPNGIGKTTILNAVTLLTSSLDFKTQKADDSPGGWTPTVSPEQRMKAFLKRNIRNIDDGGKTFRLEGIFEHNGKDYNVVLTENGFEKNELLEQPFWWAGLTYFAKFDVDMVNFQLRADLWPRFKQAYEAVTGYTIEPEIYTETDLKEKGEDAEVAVGFWLTKPTGKIHCRKCSAGERKLAKAFTQVVNLEAERRPEIVLIDNLELHVHYKRHLNMVEEVKDLFKGMQIIATTHSVTIIEKYEPKQDVIDIEEVLLKGVS